MKRKLIIGGIFVVLAAAMALIVFLNNPNAAQTNPGNAVTLTPDGKVVVPQNEHAKFTVVADMPRAAKTATNTAAGAPPK